MLRCDRKVIDGRDGASELVPSPSIETAAELLLSVSL